VPGKEISNRYCNMKNNAILKQDFQRYEEQMVDWIKIKV
jgi:hypothetical protein